MTYPTFRKEPPYELLYCLGVFAAVVVVWMVVRAVVYETARPDEHPRCSDGWVEAHSLRCSASLNPSACKARLQLRITQDCQP